MPASSRRLAAPWPPNHPPPFFDDVTLSATSLRVGARGLRPHGTYYKVTIAPSTRAKQDEASKKKKNAKTPEHAHDLKSRLHRENTSSASTCRVSR